MAEEKEKKAYETYGPKKWMFLAMTYIIYFVPMIVVVSVFFPMMKFKSESLKVASGMLLVLLNTIPFIMGILRKFFAHFPFLNIVAIALCGLCLFFTSDTFKNYNYTILTIEAVASVSSIASCWCYYQYMKYKEKDKTIKTLLQSGALDK